MTTDALRIKPTLERENNETRHACRRFDEQLHITRSTRRCQARIRHRSPAL